MSVEEYLRLLAAVQTTAVETVQSVRSEVKEVVADVKKVKRKVSAYQRRYGRAYKKLRSKATLKSGKMRKGMTHKKLVKLAHKEAKRGGKR